MSKLPSNDCSVSVKGEVIVSDALEGKARLNEWTLQRESQRDASTAMADTGSLPRCKVMERTPAQSRRTWKASSKLCFHGLSGSIPVARQGCKGQTVTSAWCRKNKMGPPVSRPRFQPDPA